MADGRQGSSGRGGRRRNRGGGGRDRGPGPAQGNAGGGPGDDARHDDDPSYRAVGAHPDDAPEAHYEDDDSQAAMLPPRPDGGVRPPSAERDLSPEDEYVFVIEYDRGRREYVGTCLEFPDVRVSGRKREMVFDELRDAVESEAEIRRRRSERIPEPLASYDYPERLELSLSQGLFRRLDLLSRQERLPIERLATELLVSALDRRLDPPAPPAKQGQSQGGGGRNNRQGGGGRRSQGRNFHKTMESGENFLEYVRNLEKGGGNPNWRKK